MVLPIAAVSSVSPTSYISGSAGAPGAGAADFGSALARSQVVAIIISAVILVSFLALWKVARAADPPLNRFLSALALHHDNFRPFMLGRLEFGRVAYYVAMTYFFLLASTKVLEARRWR